MNQFNTDKHELLNKIMPGPLDRETIIKDRQSLTEIHIPNEYLPIIEPPKSESLERGLSPLSLDFALGINTYTRQRFGMDIALLERDHPLDALGAKVVEIGQQHLDRVDRELAAIRAK